MLWYFPGGASPEMGPTSILPSSQIMGIDDDPDADFDTIQAAVDAASDGDEILVMPGTYTGSGDAVVTMNGRSLLLHSSDGAEVTIIDGEGQRRGMYCDNALVIQVSGAWAVRLADDCVHPAC